MPSPYIKKLAKETGKSENELEKFWDKAKKIAAEDFGVSEDNFESKHWKYVTGIVKNMAGVNEKVYSVQEFLESSKSVDEYITELVSSGDFAKLDKDVVGKKKKKDDEENDDDDEEMSDEDIDEEINKELENDKEEISEEEIKETNEVEKPEEPKKEQHNIEEILKEYQVTGVFPTEEDVIVELENPKQEQKWIRFPTLDDAQSELGFDDSLIEY